MIRDILLSPNPYYLCGIQTEVLTRYVSQTTGALVAVKSVNLSKLNKKLKENLYCEIEILKGLHHPHIVALIDCRETASHIHLVMEYCELGDLSYFIKKRDRLADNPALRDMVRKYPMPASGGLNEVIVRHFLKQLASAMQFLRDRNFIHRDIKPQNLLLLPPPQYLANAKDQPLVMSASNEPLIPMVGLNTLPMLKIADFGFARSLPSTSLAETLCGSPLYMAPEILRYEKYDAKADLWSAGTVLFEMMVGKPPFRASNHVELLRRIEQSEDHISFPKSTIISDGMRQLIKALLKRTPVERLPFEDFFSHEVVVEPIPGLVGDDAPKEARSKSRPEETGLSRNSSLRRERRPGSSSEKVPKSSDTQAYASSPRDRPISSSPKNATVEPARQTTGADPTESRPNTYDKVRPPLNPLAAAPAVEARQGTRTRTFNPLSRPAEGNARRTSVEEDLAKLQALRDSSNKEEIAEAEQAVRDAREYVLVEKRAVEVNAFADEMAANPRIAGAKQVLPSKTGQVARRTSSHGSPTSPISTVSAPARGLHITTKGQANAPSRPSSYGKSYGSSPSTTSAIAKALQGASVRMFGVSWSPSLVGKGVSPPQYSPFPAYPAPQVTAGLLEDNRPTGPLDEDQRAIKIIEDIATRSDVVYGFAEVKYKQLIPLAPSVDHGLGGLTANKSGDPHEEDDGLTVEATVSLCEEALVLYVKSLSLLAKSMDYAGAWWSRRSRGEVLSGPQVSKRESEHVIAAGNRINAAVQWVRGRFNEVLEKAEIVRLKLLEAQKQLPEDHPGHPSNHTSASKVAGTSASTGGVHLSSGITAEKLMYDRALEMSRAAAINEIANEDLAGCDISYVTAIRMLEAVLENDDEVSPQRKRSGSLKEGTETKNESDGAMVNGINLEDRQAVQKGMMPLFSIFWCLALTMF